MQNIIQFQLNTAQKTCSSIGTFMRGNSSDKVNKVQIINYQLSKKFRYFKNIKINYLTNILLPPSYVSLNMPLISKA